jgi:hypothetical protein
MTSRRFPFLALLPAAVLLAALAVPGCGGGDFDGAADVPGGYATYRGDGVSFVHPEGWEATERDLGKGITEVRFQDPAAAGEADAAVSLTIQPGVGERFDAMLESERAVLESAGGAGVSQDEVDVPGARKAYRRSIESDGAASEAIDVLAPDGRHIALAAGGPDDQSDAVDAGAVVDSLRLGEQR